VPFVLVTGGAGFVGARVVAAVAAAGHDVRVLDRRAPDTPVPAADVVDGDLRDPDAVAAAVEGVDAVCHHAAMVGLGVDIGDVVDYVSHNDLGTAVLLRALAARRFAGRLVLASSMVVYGEGRYECAEHGVVVPPPRRVEDLAAGRFEPPCPRCGAPLTPGTVPEDAAPDPRSVYAATKLHQEHLCAAFARETAASLTVLRYHNVFGPGMPRDTPYAGVAAIFRSALASGRAPRVFEDGAQRRDFVQVDDVARANVLALRAGESGTFNVASGSPRTVGELATALWVAAGGAAAAPAPVITGEFRLGDVRHVVGSTERAAAVLGFRARVGLEAGIGELVEAR
jgi:dTDP-L-rhamnose 4-epimerase